jgi:hypothetical protein
MESLDVCLHPTQWIATREAKKTQAYFNCLLSFRENAPADEKEVGGANVVLKTGKTEPTRKYNLLAAGSIA